MFQKSLSAAARHNIVYEDITYVTKCNKGESKNHFLNKTTLNCFNCSRCWEEFIIWILLFFSSYFSD